MPNPADIARALSEDEARWLLAMTKYEWLSSGLIHWRSKASSTGAKCAGFMTRIGNGANPLIDAKMGGAQIKLYRLTDLGLAVRDHLLNCPTASDASTDRTPATVDGCGRKVEENERR